MAADDLRAARAPARNAAYSLCRREQSAGRQGVRISESGFLAADGSHAHTLLYGKTSGFDYAFFQAPAFAARILKIQIGVVDLVGKNFTQGTGHVGFVQTPRVKQNRLGSGQCVNGGIRRFHKYGKSVTVFTSYDV